jgi:hypothetical protein
MTLGSACGRQIGCGISKAEANSGNPASFFGQDRTQAVPASPGPVDELVDGLQPDQLSLIG